MFHFRWLFSRRGKAQPTTDQADRQVLSASNLSSSSTQSFRRFFRPQLESLEQRVVLSNDFYTVPGEVGTADAPNTIPVTIVWEGGESAFNNSLMVYQIENTSGSVGGVNPGDNGYAASIGARVADGAPVISFTASLDPTDNSVTPGNGSALVFRPEDGIGTRRTFLMDAGSLLGFALIQNVPAESYGGAAQQAAQTGSTIFNTFAGGPVAYYSFDAANPFGGDAVISQNLGNGLVRFGFEDQGAGGDGDYNDMVILVSPTGNRAEAIPGVAGDPVDATFSLLQANSNSIHELGIFTFDDFQGGIDTGEADIRPNVNVFTFPGDSGYIQTALAPDRRMTIFGPNTPVGSTSMLQLDGETNYGFYAIVGGTAEQFLESNPNNFDEAGIQALFSFPELNNSKAQHFRNLGNNTFAFESIPNKDDGVDFDDLVFNVSYDLVPQITAALENDTSNPDFGGSDTDGITNDPGISGTIDERNLTAFTVDIDELGEVDILDTFPGAFDPSTGQFILNEDQVIQAAGGLLDEGEHTAVFRATDTNNKTGAATVAFTFDSEVEPFVELDLPPEFDTGIPGDNITDLDLVNIVGTIEEGSTITLFREVDPTSDPIELETLLDDDGTFTFVDVQLSFGTNTFTTMATDTAGNVDDLGEIIITHQPSLLLPPEFDTGVIGDNSTVISLVNLSGRTLPGATVELRPNGDTTVLATETADADGNFTFENISLMEGDNPYDIRAILNGDEELFENVLTVSLELLTAGLEMDTGLFDTDGVTNDPTISGQVSDGATLTELTASLDGASAVNIFSNYDPATNTFRLDRAALDLLAGGTLADGAHSIQIFGTTAAGSTGRATVDFTLDTVLNPTSTVTLPPQFDTGTEGDNITDLDTIGLTGDAEGAASVTLTRVEGAETVTLDTQVANESNEFEFTNVTLNLGANVFTSTTTDLAGNTEQAQITVTHAPSLTLPAEFDTDAPDDQITFRGTVNLTGQTLPNASVELLRTGDTTVIDTVTADVNGAFTFENVTLDVNDNSFDLNVTSDGTTERTEAALVVTRRIVELARDSDSGTLKDASTNQESVNLFGELTGIAQGTATITLNETGQTAVLPDVDANATFQFGNVALAEGANSFSLTIEDSNGAMIVTDTQIITRMNSAPTRIATNDDPIEVELSSFVDDPSNTLPTQNFSEGIDLATFFTDADLTNSLIRFNTNSTVNNGIIDIETLDAEAPATVVNFLNYVTDGDYDGTIFHRSPPGFVLQGGGFEYDPGPPSSLPRTPTDPEVVNEFDGENRSNLDGTLAMAKVGPTGQDPTPESINSATNQFFFNLGDNSGNLDNQNGGFTVFAEVADDGTSRQVVDDLASIPVIDAGGFTDLPFRGSDTIGVPAGTEPDDYAFVSSAEIVYRLEELTYVVTVTPVGTPSSTIDVRLNTQENRLFVDYVEGDTGTFNIEVTAVDSSGAVSAQTQVITLEITNTQS
ncbi:MAG: Ig-like domain-containing protein [Gemmataceae bacterium]